MEFRAVFRCVALLALFGAIVQGAAIGSFAPPPAPLSQPDRASLAASAPGRDCGGWREPAGYGGGAPLNTRGLDAAVNSSSEHARLRVLSLAANAISALAGSTAGAANGLRAPPR